MIRVASRLKFISCGSYASPFAVSLIRRFALWSMKKDRDLEASLTRNHRWIVNNQIKNILMRYPNQAAPVDFIQRKFKSLSMRGRALNWLNKYPSCFEVFIENNEQYCRLTKRITSLIEEEEYVKEKQEPVFMERLAKILMMTTNKRLNVVKLDELKRSFGFPDDYLIRIVAKYSEMFRLINYGGRKSSMEVELISWKPEFALSQIEMSALQQNKEPCFSCSLPLSWVKTWERFNEFNSTPYISPYSDSFGLIEGSIESKKRVIGLVHELLSLSLWKKISIIKLTHFKREFVFPENLNVLLLQHPGSFYVTNKYKTYTVLLREAYRGSDLIQKDPLVVVKDKFGQVMQDGRHEYVQRRRLLNLEKEKKKGVILPKVANVKDIAYVKDKANVRDKYAERPEKKAQARQVGGLFDPEERKKFYKILFDEDS